jgi:hypothetical protein
LVQKNAWRNITTVCSRWHWWGQTTISQFFLSFQTVRDKMIRTFVNASLRWSLLNEYKQIAAEIFTRGRCITFILCLKLKFLKNLYCCSSNFSYNFGKYSIIFNNINILVEKEFTYIIGKINVFPIYINQWKAYFEIQIIVYNMITRSTRKGGVQWTQPPPDVATRASGKEPRRTPKQKQDRAQGHGQANH